MSRRYLEVTYRRGQPMAAYFYLPRQPGDQSARVERSELGFLVDWSADGRPIGVEIPSPSLAARQSLNRVLGSLGLEPATAEDFAPLDAGPSAQSAGR